MKAKELQSFCEKWLWKTFNMGLRQSPTDANNSEFYAPLIGLNLSKEMAEEINKYAKEQAVEFDNWKAERAVDMVKKYGSEWLTRYEETSELYDQFKQWTIS